MQALPPAVFETLVLILALVWLWVLLWSLE